MSSEIEEINRFYEEQHKRIQSERQKQTELLTQAEAALQALETAPDDMEDFDDER